MFKIATSFAASLYVLVATSSVSKADLKVVASIKPIHSLVAGVMAGMGEPELILDGAASPHTYSLKPSQAQTLADADVIFWVSPELEAFLVKPIEITGKNAQNVALIETKGLVTHRFRDDAAFESHDHSSHVKDEQAHDGHEHDESSHDDHGHDDQGHAAHKHEEGHDDHAGHDHGNNAIDPHIFLDPVNAKRMVREIAKTLSKADAANKDGYRENAKRIEKQLDALIDETEQRFVNLENPKFVVFHDAYHYFEERFGFEAGGSITLSPEIAPTVSRIREVRERIEKLGAACVFAESQFPDKLVNTVTEGLQVKTGVLDPLGANIKAGPALYSELISQMADAFENCAKAQS